MVGKKGWAGGKMKFYISFHENCCSFGVTAPDNHYTFGIEKKSRLVESGEHGRFAYLSDILSTRNYTRSMP